MFCSGWILVSGIVRQIAQRHLARQRVVGILDQAFDGIVTAKVNFETNLQNARALFESHLQSVFTQRGEGWVEKPLRAVRGFQNACAFRSGDYIESSNTLNILDPARIKHDYRSC
ncbi:MAG: hypothetical protein Q8N48_14290 [Thiobacillus sp.]|nr:hypothetical protein [Thiobacillus sp.]MDP2979983.1 hypothetical protein [Thiobacillus sp.]